MICDQCYVLVVQVSHGFKSMVSGQAAEPCLYVSCRVGLSRVPASSRVLGVSRYTIRKGKLAIDFRVLKKTLKRPVGVPTA